MSPKTSRSYFLDLRICDLTCKKVSRSDGVRSLKTGRGS